MQSIGLSIVKLKLNTRLQKFAGLLESAGDCLNDGCSLQRPCLIQMNDAKHCAVNRQTKV